MPEFTNNPNTKLREFTAPDQVDPGAEITPEREFATVSFEISHPTISGLEHEHLLLQVTLSTEHPDDPLHASIMVFLGGESLTWVRVASDPVDPPAWAVQAHQAALRIYREEVR